MSNPIIERELIGLLRTRRALVIQTLLAAALAGLVVLRWPSDARVDLTGSGAQQVMRVFSYGLMTLLILLAPVFPATTIVKEKVQGTLALLLNSPMSPWAIYLGKLAGVLGFVVVLMTLSLPTLAACYAMGGVDLFGQVGALYLVLCFVALQYATLGLLVSSHAGSTDAALRMTYGLILVLSVLAMGPHQFLQGTELGVLAQASLLLRSLSPIPAVMEALGQADVGAQGLSAGGGSIRRYVVLAGLTSLAFMVLTARRLNQTMFDRARDQGLVTDERSASVRAFRRFYYLWFFDPQRRSGMIGPLTNPVMVKEFRTRRFGRSHWMMRMIALCVIVSLGLAWMSSLQTMTWGVETVGGIMVLLQVALIVLVTPSLAAGLISSERESGGWTLLQMTPLSTGRIVRGKLMSVVATLLLLLLATLPGYLVMMFVQPALLKQVYQVMICLALTSLLALLASAAVSSCFRRTAAATTVSYALLVTLCAGTMLFWLGRDAPFNHATVEAVLTINPLAAALQVIGAEGFTQYRLLPANWWVMAGLILLSLLVLVARVFRLTRPQ